MSLKTLLLTASVSIVLGLSWFATQNMQDYKSPYEGKRATCKLDLSDDQLTSIRIEFDMMNKMSKKVGLESIELEKRIDDDFYSGNKTGSCIIGKISTINYLRGE